MSRYVTPEEKYHACTIDLAAWLLRHHSEAVELKYGSVILRADHHVSVKEGYSGYYNFKTGESGNCIDYLMNYLGYDYPTAVEALNEYPASDCSIRSMDKNKESTSVEVRSKAINLPDASTDSRRVYAYLINRCMPAEIITMLMRKGLIYESAVHHNAIFVNHERDYCEIRGTNTYADSRCKRSTSCTDYSPSEHGWCSCMQECNDYKSSSFHGCRKSRADRFWYMRPNNDKPVEKIFICEAAIDAVSLFVLQKQEDVASVDDAVYISIGGVSNQQTIDRIKHHSLCPVVIAVDTDQAGEECRIRNPELTAIVPDRKDWNEDLRKGKII